MPDNRITEILQAAEEDKLGRVTTAREVALPFLSAERLAISFYPKEIDRARAAAAVANLQSIPSSFRDTLEQDIYRFYCQEIEDGSCNFDTPQDQLDFEVGMRSGFENPRHATVPGEVWPLVRFTKIDIGYRLDAERTIVRVEGQAAWDTEHGIVLHFEDGQRLLKVSGWGHFI